MLPEPLIDARDLGRRFGQQLAVEYLSFTLQPGRVLAMLGPNGAGKTTSMRMLAGLLAPSSGSALVCGHTLGQSESGNAAIRSRCGVVPEAPGFYERLSARDNLQFFGALQGLRGKDLQQRCDAELQRFGLLARADDRVGVWSKGMKQRLSLARALLHRPALLFLDEPTAGLDPRASADLHVLIDSLRREGCGIVLSTHILEEAEQLADEILVIDTRTLFHGAPAALQASGGACVEIELAQPLPIAIDCTNGVQLLRQQGRVSEYRLEDAALQTPELVRLLVAAGAQIVRVAPQQRGLRARYLELLGRDQAVAA